MTTGSHYRAYCPTHIHHLHAQFFLEATDTLGKPLHRKLNLRQPLKCLFWVILWVPGRSSLSEPAQQEGYSH
jgi:hypothetical protein